MKDKTETKLEAICRKVEHMLGGDVLCAFQGFAQYRPALEDEGVVIEVFFASAGSARSIMRATYEDRDKLSALIGAPVSIVVHYESDTIKHYLDDVINILSQRFAAQTVASQLPATIVDPGAYGSETRTSQRTPWEQSHVLISPREPNLVTSSGQLF